MGQTEHKTSIDDIGGWAARRDLKEGSELFKRLVNSGEWWVVISCSEDVCKQMTKLVTDESRGRDTVAITHVAKGSRFAFMFWLRRDAWTVEEIAKAISFQPHQLTRSFAANKGCAVTSDGIQDQLNGERLLRVAYSGIPE